MDHWVEAADWIVWQLCGNYVRNACTAGYKGIYQDGALPVARTSSPRSNPDFADFVADKLDAPDRPARRRAPAGSPPRPPRWTGLPEGIAVAVGNVDAHVTAPAAQAVEPGQMVAIMGTSTCHVMNGDRLREVPGMCGVVDGGIVAGLLGLRGRPERRRRHLRLVRRQRRARRRTATAAAAAGSSVHELPHRARRRPGRSASTGWSRSTGTAATARCSSTTSCPA